MDAPLEHIRFLRGVMFRGESRAPGDEMDVTPREAFTLVEGYHDAERVDGSSRKATASTVGDALEVVHGDPVAEHRDPAPARKRRRS